MSPSLFGHADLFQPLASGTQLSSVMRAAVMILSSKMANGLVYLVTLSDASDILKINLVR